MLSLDHVVLRVAEQDKIHARLAGHGIAIVEEGERYGASGVGPAIDLRDPDGNIVEFKAATNAPPSRAGP